MSDLKREFWTDLFRQAKRRAYIRGAMLGLTIGLLIGAIWSPMSCSPW